MTAKLKTKPARAEGDGGLFDLDKARSLAGASCEVAMQKGAPVAGVIMHEGARVIIREWPDGRVERLTSGGEWRAWTRGG